MLKIDNISKQFGKKQVLKDVSLELNPGERIHIIGKNGSGKSTIFKIITNILKADAGQVELAENDYVGALIENPGFLEYESGLENLKFLGNLNHNYDEQVAMKLMEKFDLDPNDLQAVSKYSIGMRQKLGIIQAVMENQNIVLLDEPTRGIDKEGVATFVKLLDELKQEKSAVIIASHDEIPGLKYDRELLLKNGELASV
ncbi:ATP-binding cassette domain-containing protein [Lactobacillus jensenii]|jgi:copper ABC transporter, ATP-binding protein NosF|uniref:ABC transporter ATP-binding protein n=1 Tax=Lactobacillus TaxID=1578 RepID=UPI0006F18156|nr:MULTISPECIES: ATP-binding cassette domain-containing protein [Lactobacillus]KRM50232.1 copper transport ATP-binding protein NosF [Lactobacillus jensenii DSM 20557]MBQ4669780.1 ATP-binding cassette domain-containing protein [Lactobacillus jensenii]MBS5831845.1 ATP-binding cassette domain-containing protein [Lactobacillus jensenii]MBW8449143.1 ATP-binding cassette domain-containing protein [Lactobacillus jensenii]MCT7875669.1 ATP-binding cassette domain-containing protein [Lactobacillus iners